MVDALRWGDALTSTRTIAACGFAFACALLCWALALAGSKDPAMAGVETPERQSQLHSPKLVSHQPEDSPYRVPEQEDVAPMEGQVKEPATWAEAAVMLDGVRLADVDLDSIQQNEMHAWRNAIRAMQIELRDEFLFGLADGYPRIPSDPLTSNHLIGTMDIYYMVREEGNTWNHIFVPRAGNQRIYSLRDAAKKLLESPAGREEMASLKDRALATIAETHPDVPYRLETSEDGSRYTFWADFGNGEVVIGTASYPLIQ